MDGASGVSHFGGTATQLLTQPISLSGENEVSASDIGSTSMHMWVPSIASFGLEAGTNKSSEEERTQIRNRTADVDGDSESDDDEITFNFKIGGGTAGQGPDDDIGALPLPSTPTFHSDIYTTRPILSSSSVHHHRRSSRSSTNHGSEVQAPRSGCFSQPSSSEESIDLLGSDTSPAQPGTTTAVATTVARNDMTMLGKTDATLAVSANRGCHSRAEPSRFLKKSGSPQNRRFEEDKETQEFSQGIGNEDHDDLCEFSQFALMQTGSNVVPTPALEENVEFLDEESEGSVTTLELERARQSPHPRQHQRKLPTIPMLNSACDLKNAAALALVAETTATTAAQRTEVPAIQATFYRAGTFKMPSKQRQFSVVGRRPLQTKHRHQQRRSSLSKTGIQNEIKLLEDQLAQCQNALKEFDGESGPSQETMSPAPELILKHKQKNMGQLSNEGHHLLSPFSNRQRLAFTPGVASEATESLPTRTPHPFSPAIAASRRGPRSAAARSKGLHRSLLGGVAGRIALSTVIANPPCSTPILFSAACSPAATDASHCQGTPFLFSSPEAGSEVDGDDTMELFSSPGYMSTSAFVQPALQVHDAIQVPLPPIERRLLFNDG
jgi:hypothetical protein